MSVYIDVTGIIMYSQCQAVVSKQPRRHITHSNPNPPLVCIIVHVLQSDFFATLKAREAAVGPVGTFHATGRRRDDGKLEPEDGLSTDWSCHKCAASNFRQTVQCHKCKAMKRMTTWR